MIKLNLFYTWGVIMFMLSLIFLLISMYMYMNNYCLFIEWLFMDFNSFNLIYPILMDNLSFNFMGVVSIISSMVVLYSSQYMGNKNYSSNRFLFLVILFILSMMLMIISPNMISILLGWDGLGLISYCLVIYYHSSKSYLAGMLTCLVNRMGDIGLIISLGWMTCYGSWNFMFYLDYYNKQMYIMIIISSFTKSAQIPFSMWLPAAMAAPTPVSSLVHSSTLVTAGVYLLIRFFSMLNFKNYFFIFISLMTMLMASFSAIFEFDLKKIIALSTLSQLGLMMTSLFLGMKNLTFFHLCTHAMFKSLLFLCAGIYIFYMNDNQDVRYMSSVSQTMPLTTCCFTISNLTLCGIPFLSGFYSKDMIMELFSSMEYNLFIYLIMYLSLSLTIMYTTRLLYYSIFYSSKNNSLNMFMESFMIMKLSISILTFSSVLFGCYLMWISNLNINLILLTFSNKMMTLIMIITGLFMAMEMLMMKNYFMKNNFYESTNMWLMYNFSFYIYMMNMKFIYKYSNMLNWGELYGPMGSAKYIINLSNIMQNYSINNFKIMLISLFIWIMIII
nr:NADH dehydrogenase subunit 5 [Membranacea stenoprocessa]